MIEWKYWMMHKTREIPLESKSYSMGGKQQQNVLDTLQNYCWKENGSLPLSLMTMELEKCLTKYGDEASHVVGDWVNTKPKQSSRRASWKNPVIKKIIVRKEVLSIRKSWKLNRKGDGRCVPLLSNVLKGITVVNCGRIQSCPLTQMCKINLWKFNWNGSRLVMT